MAVTLEPRLASRNVNLSCRAPVLPPPEVRDLPEPPRQMWRLIGPGVVGAGVGLASGEFILWPYITSQVGLIFLWGALLGVVVQWFLNMEIERYTLATGETAVTGFNRYWKYWGLVFAVMVDRPAGNGECRRRQATVLVAVCGAVVGAGRGI